MNFTDLTDKTIIVTGSSGFLGSYVLHELNLIGCTVIRLGEHSYDQDPSLSRLNIIEIVGSLSATEIWQKTLENNPVDYIFHLAAQTSFYKAEADPAWEFECNVKPLLALLEACKKTNRSPGIIHTGTVSQYGLTEDLPVVETHTDNPISIHDFHKSIAEGYLKLYTRRGYANGATLRLANVYGAPLREEKAKERGVINKIINFALSGNELQIYGDWSYLRDYVHVKDVAKAILCAALNINSIKGKHWNISCGTGHTLNQLFEQIIENIQKQTKREIDVKHIDEPEGMLEIEKRNFIGDISNFTKNTGWRPNISFEEGIARTVESIIQMNKSTKS